MISKKCFEYAELELIEIEHCLHSISDDWSSSRIVKAYKKIAIYNIDRILKTYGDFLTPYDNSQLKQLREHIKKYNQNHKDGICFKDKFPYGYEDMYNPKWLYNSIHSQNNKNKDDIDTEKESAD